MGNSPPDATKAEQRSPVQANAEPPKDGELKQDPSVKNETNADPLGPPPRPAPTQQTPDYFSVTHGTSLEANPFEASFAYGAGGQVQTPGGTKLPSVAALTSPAGLLGGLGGTGTTPNFWGGSLRTGPLSPAMLSGPQGNDYFSDGRLHGSFPTPTESGLRTGLTPGGGGTMFPEPSPGANLFSISNVQTPSALEFARTAASAKAREQSQQNVTSQPTMSNGMDVKPPVGQFDQHDANDAANGLYLLANQNGSRNGAQPANHYAMAPQVSVHAHPNQSMHMRGQSTDTSPNMDMRGNGSLSENSGRGVSEMSGFSDDNESKGPKTRAQKNKGAAAQTNGRRKADETPTRGGPANKKSKGNNGAANAMQSEPQSEEEPDMSKEEYHSNGKKMTEDEKRKNFLERNRVAALKCRQRKKQWLANLQQKVEMFSSENDQLSQQITTLRDEVVNLKTLLMAHKECPISQTQGIGGTAMDSFIGGQPYHHQVNPYGMGMPAPNQMMGQHQGMQQEQNMQPQRRFS